MALDERWGDVEKGIAKFKRIQEGLEPRFTSEEYMKLYSTIYNICLKKDQIHIRSLPQVHEIHKQLLVDYINSTVLSSVREKHDECLLRDLVTSWSKFKEISKWLSRLFSFLDRRARGCSLPSLNEVRLVCFYDLVYRDISMKAKDAVIALIDAEREGSQIDGVLLKNVLDIYVEIGEGKMDYYEKDFEEHMLDDTAAYYSGKASRWILEDSYQEYKLKVDECLKNEKDRVAHYLHPISEQKLLERVQNGLLVYENQLLEKEKSGCSALLEHDKHTTDDRAV